jgi:hypothetical protein
MNVAFTRGAIYESSHEGQADTVKSLTLSPKQRRDLVEELTTTFPDLVRCENSVEAGSV